MSGVEPQSADVVLKKNQQFQKEWTKKVGVCSGERTLKRKTL